MARTAQHTLVHRHVVQILDKFKIRCALIRGKSKNDSPFALILKEGTHRVLAHVWSKSHRIEIHCLVKGAGIHGGRIAYVAALGVGNYELVGIIGTYIAYGSVKHSETIGSESFVECKIRLIGNTIGCGSIDYSLVETKHRVLSVSVVGKQMLRNFFYVGVESDAKERAFAEYIFDQFCTLHKFFIFSWLLFSEQIAAHRNVRIRL